MAVRKSEIRKLRRELITRKAQVWSRLNKSLVKSLNEIVQVWLKKVERYTDDIPDLPEIPDKFTKTINKTLREALAYGYWLNHIYLQELRAAYNKTKYRGKVTLADKLSDEDKIRKSLEKLINFGKASEWHEVIPEDAVKWLEGYTPSLAGNLHKSVLEKTRDVIRQSMMEGATLPERMKALREAAPELEAMSKARIESIARTEITRADTMGTLISAKSNSDVIGFEFSAIMDDRVTDICASRHGLFMKIDDAKLAENTPPLHVNCLLGDTLVLPIGSVSAVSERVFDGDICVIKTAGGNNLSGTPNHPILTSRGWVALGEIHEGDYVVCDAVRERGNISYGKNQQMITRIENAAYTFFNNSQMTTVPVPTSTEDFHHDGGQSEVAIIYTDRELFQRREPFSDKQIVEHDFIFRDVVCSLFENCKRMFFFFFNRFFAPSYSVMSFLRKFFSFFKRCVSHSLKLLLMPVTWFNAISKQNKSDSSVGIMQSFSNTSDTYTIIMQSDDSFVVNGVNRTFPLNSAFEQDIINSIEINAVFFLKLIESKSRQVIFDKVVFVNRMRSTVHVYNLQTESGIFVANNIITHNCRSMLLACTIYDYPDGINTSHEFDEPEFPSAMQRPEDIEEVKKILEKSETESNPEPKPKIQFHFNAPEEWQSPETVIEPAEPVKSDIPNITLKPYESSPMGEETIRGVKVSDIQPKRDFRGHVYGLQTMPEDIQRYYGDVGIKITIEEAQDIYRAVYAYTAEGYKTMPNAYLKYQNGLPLTSEEQKLVWQYQLCMEYTKVAPMYKRAGEIYRGIKISGSEYSQRVLSLQVGDTFDLGRPASFTDDEKQAKKFVADMFAENKEEISGIIFHVDTKKLNNSTSIMGIAMFSEEQEVLVNDRLFEVIKIDDQRKGFLDESINRAYEPDNNLHIYLRPKEK